MRVCVSDVCAKCARGAEDPGAHRGGPWGAGAGGASAVRPAGRRASAQNGLGRAAAGEGVCRVRVMIHCFSHLTCTHIHSAVWSFVILGDGSHFDFYFDFHSHVRGGVHIA